ncbi:MAG: aconitate hydratase AcnA [Planctomycetes bacterium]|nr:aconitate hydratase AcnA [Planctomycetota bacterium]
MNDSFRARTQLEVGGKKYRIASLKALEQQGRRLERLPWSLRILLENLLRNEDGVAITAPSIEAILNWKPKAEPDQEIAFTPARVLLQDFTGVPVVVDLASMRDAMVALGGDPKKINPGVPLELVIDHSVQVDYFGTSDALAQNNHIEFERNRERYLFLRWGQQALKNFRAVPPATGIVHQVNLEYLARVVMTKEGPDGLEAFPDTVVGTDSHTTMINGLGVLGWGVGGIEAEAAMLGQPVSMLLPQVVGFELKGELAEGSTATDLVLRVTELLRKKGVVGKFVEFFGSGVAALSLADRATIANMAPEYGATCGIFPVDSVTLDYLRFTGRDEAQVALVEAYMKAQGLFVTKSTPTPEYTDTLALDLATVEPALAGPKRPQDRVNLSDVKAGFRNSLHEMVAGASGGSKPKAAAVGRMESEGGHTAAALVEPFSENDGVECELDGAKFRLRHGSVVIAAITSCTNTSNPSVLVAAGLVAKKAVERGLRSQPWVKTSLAPGSKVVTAYLKEAGLTPFLEQLGFYTVGYGCTTCIGNSGPLPAAVGQAIDDGQLVAAAVLSGNRNFEGRVHAQVRANYLASPPLVVAYALAGRVDFDPKTEALGVGKDGKPVYLRDVWPTQAEIREAVARSVRPEHFRQNYANVFEGSNEWRALDVPKGDTYAWDAKSTYVKRAPYFDAMPKTPAPFKEIRGARVLALLGDSITTDHISPAGNIKASSPAGKWLQEHGVKPADFNSYGARRGHDEVMARGTFANSRIKNKLLDGVEGGETKHLPSGTQMSIFDAAQRYATEKTALIVIAGKEYGSGSSRDWAAKGPLLQGVRAVIAESYERIHRSNLVGMGIVPFQFRPGESAASLGLTGAEHFDFVGLGDALASGFANGREFVVRAKTDDGSAKEFRALVRIDTPQEVVYMRHGGILQYVLRKLAGVAR